MPFIPRKEVARSAASCHFTHLFTLNIRVSTFKVDWETQFHRYRLFYEHSVEVLQQLAH